MRRALVSVAAMALVSVAGCHPTTTGDGVGAFPAWSDGVAACQEEDGSSPGQPFPCRWESADQGNGQGMSYTLTTAP